MSWQNILFTGGNIIFIIALLPTVFGKNDKPAVTTSLITGATLLAYTIAFMSLQFWSAGIMALVLAILWITLLIQKLHQKPKKN